MSLRVITRNRPYVPNRPRYIISVFGWSLIFLNSTCHCKKILNVDQPQGRLYLDVWLVAYPFFRECHIKAGDDYLWNM